MCARAPSPELAFLLHCARASAPLPTEELDRQSAVVTDWPHLFELAARHAVIPLIYRQLIRVSPGIVPSTTIAAFDSAARDRAIRSLQLAGQLVVVVRELKRHGIDAIPVKGPTLAALVYGNLSLRQYDDLDVLVRLEDVGRSRETLAALGFRAVVPVFNDSRDSLLPQDIEEAFTHAESAISFELHWSLNHRTLAHGTLDDRWWEDRQQVVLGGEAIRTLGAERLILYLCMHGAKHSWARIGWLCDLQRCLATFASADWAVIWRMAGENGAERMVAVALLLVSNLLDAGSLTERAFALVPPGRRSRAIAGSIRDRLLHSPLFVPEIDFAMQLRLRERLRDRARYAIHILAEPWPADVTALEFPRALRGAYYMFRPLRLAWKYLARHRCWNVDPGPCWCTRSRPCTRTASRSRARSANG
jgi:hypothetical protein